MQTVGVIGLGWLGLPLAVYLKNKGYEIKGTVTSTAKRKQIEEIGINCCELKLNENFEEDFFRNFFKDCSYCILTIPPPKNFASTYPNLIEKALDLLPSTCKVIFTSSTSVYAENNENAIENSSILSHFNYTSPIYLVEKIIQKKYPNNHLILRLGGLLGEDRNPVKFLAGKTNLPNALSPINVVHLEDVIEIIFDFIDKKDCFGIYNVCCDNTSSRKEFYSNQAKKFNLPEPIFNEELYITKKVNSEKVKKDLNFTFKHNFL